MLRRVSSLLTQIKRLHNPSEKVRFSHQYVLKALSLACSCSDREKSSRCCTAELSLIQLKAFEIPLPPIKVQQQISQHRYHPKQCVASKFNYKKGHWTHELKQSILQEAFNGSVNHRAYRNFWNPMNGPYPERSQLRNRIPMIVPQGELLESSRVHSSTLRLAYWPSTKSRTRPSLPGSP